MANTVRQNIKGLIRAVLPLRFRKYISIQLGRSRWPACHVRNWWIRELLRDMEEKDRNEYHRFLWGNHLAYATTYEVEQRYGREHIKGSRRIFFSDLREHLLALGVAPGSDVRSVFEVGCSSGYQLRFAETELFTAAEELKGIDIDDHAVSAGMEYLKGLGSKVSIVYGDMTRLDDILGDKTYDVVICTGVLMYLDEAEAFRLVKGLIRRSKVLAAFSGPAHPLTDNCRLERSVVREHDGSFIHNMDAMVRKAGGEVYSRRWEGSRIVDGHTIYFVFGANGGGPAKRAA